MYFWALPISKLTSKVGQRPSLMRLEKNLAVFSGLQLIVVAKGTNFESYLAYEASLTGLIILVR